MDRNFPHVPNEVIESADISKLGGGWGLDNQTEQERLSMERALFAKNEGKATFQMQEAVPPVPEILAKWKQFQKDNGRLGEESNDMTLLDKFVFGREYTFKPQPIGNCVAANACRPWATRSLWQSVFYQGERLGNDEFGYGSISPFMAASYGFMRQRANLRRGDGGFGSAMDESFVEDGIIPCSEEDLRSIVGTSEGAYPEIQDERLYRKFGTWDYNTRLRPKAKYKLQEGPRIESLDMLWDAIMAGKPCHTCSMFGWAHRGTHRDGFPIGIRSGQWAHCMGTEGAFTASNGDRVFVWHTLSWVHGGPEDKWIFYAIWDDRLERDFERMECYAIGQIEGLESNPPLVTP